MNEKAKTTCVCGKEKAWDESLCPECQKLESVKHELVEVKASPLATINLAVEKGLDLEKVEKALMLQERWEKNEARKAYHKAMAEFKAESPTVTKDKTNTQYDSKYTSLGNLINTVNPILSKHGLTASWDIVQNGNIKVICKLTHCFGHSETASMSADADTSGAKSKIQQIKSTITYLKAVTFESICGLASSDANLDDDGQGEIEYIDDKQLHILRDNLISAEAKEEPLCKHFGIEGLDKLLKSDYQRALVAVKAKKEVKVEK